jgi:hypothetical protein
MTATPLQGISYTGTLEYVALKMVSTGGKAASTRAQRMEGQIGEEERVQRRSQAA